MIDKVQIIYPAIAMFLLTAIMILSLGLCRFLAIKRGEVSIKYYRAYNEGVQPDWLHILGRHVQLHFEVPPLFYAGVIFIWLTDAVTQWALIFAWAFFVLRCLHSLIHLGPNNVNARFFCFGMSMMSLAGLWGCLIYRLL